MKLRFAWLLALIAAAGMSIILRLVKKGPDQAAAAGPQGGY